MQTLSNDTLTQHNLEPAAIHPTVAGEIAVHYYILTKIDDIKYQDNVCSREISMNIIM